MSNDFPGPTPRMFVGNIFDIGTKPDTILPSFLKLVNDYGDIVKVWIGPFKYFILVTNKDVVQYFLTSKTEINKTDTYDLVKPFVGEGLATSNGCKWRNHRKIIDPAFHYSTSNYFISMFNEKINIFLKKIDSYDRQKSIDIKEWINLYSLDSICEAVMATKINGQTDDPVFIKAFENILYIITNRIFSLTKRNDYLFKLSWDYKSFCSSLKIINDLSDNIIKDGKLKDTSDETEDNSFISILLKSCGEDMTEQDIQEQVNTFIFAGHDTISAAMSFALYEIAKNSEIQTKIFEEVAQVLDNNLEQNITAVHIKEFKYLDLVFKETLRKYPSIPGIERCVQEDCKIGEYNFPKGANVNIFIYGIHHDPNNFPEPAEFDPSRILNNKKPFSYIPFSMGPRNCIGQRYATMLFKVTIARIIARYSLSVPDDFTMELSIKATLTCPKEIPIYFERRK